jgi:Arc/MetJ family transcription regulator
MWHQMVVRTTINIDDDMLARAIAITGIEEKARLLNFVLENFVRAESAKRLRRLSGTMPGLVVPKRSIRYVVEDEVSSMVSDDTL